MALSALALLVTLLALLAAHWHQVQAFTPPSRAFLYGARSSSSLVTVDTPASALSAGAGFLGMGENQEDDEDEDEDDYSDDEDEDEDNVALSSPSYGSGATSPLTGMTLDPWDPNPLIKPRPSRLFQEDDTAVADEELTQTLSADERAENLKIMRQIRKNDLPDLRMRKDHAGWVEANNDLKRRYAADAWFGVNERLREASLLGEDDAKLEHLRALAEKLGGPPAGLEMQRDYAVHTEIYDIGISPSRAAGILEREIRQERSARGKAMMAERRKNLEAQQRQYQEDMRNPGLREDKEAKERRERTMRRLMEEIEADNKKKRERAKDILGKVPEPPESRTKSMEKALNEAREEVKKARRKQLKGEGSGSADLASLEGMVAGAGDDNEDQDTDDAGSKSGAQKAREAAAAEASGGRPRLPGDPDVTRGELNEEEMAIESASTTITGPLQVEVSSQYNPDQSDPPMRKHCFQYTIRITNLSETDTLQLLGRRFEIQTVGASMKDVVQGEGVTGRTPVLKPGEVFEYTSTAPLSVRPIGTTIIAARMRGEYRYVTLQPDQETASEEQLKQGGEATAELGMFHFIFPEDQRVQPVSSADMEDDDDDEDEDEDDDDEDASAVAAASKPATPSAASSSATPASTLPGDADMTSGNIEGELNDGSETVTEQVRVSVTTSYRPERSDAANDKHCFAYNIRITNESKQPIQLVSRRFEIQTVGGAHKDVVQGPGVTGRQPILQPGESFEYTSTAPLSVKPMLDRTPAVARMQGEYNFVVLGDDGATPISSTPLQAQLGKFHFVLPALDTA